MYTIKKKFASKIKIIQRKEFTKTKTYDLESLECYLIK